MTNKESSLSRVVTRRIDNLATSEITEGLVENNLYSEYFWVYKDWIYITKSWLAKYYEVEERTIERRHSESSEVFDRYWVLSLKWKKELSEILGRDIFVGTVANDTTRLNLYPLKAFLFFATRLNTKKAEQVVDFLINAGEAKLSDIYEAPTLEARLATEIALKQEADIIGIGEIARGMIIHNHGTINFVFNTTTAEHIGNIIDKSNADADTKRLLKDTIRELEAEKDYSKRSTLVAQAWELIGRTADLSAVVPVFTALISKLFS